ncbi:MAG: class I SAM-dependent methyltransferase [Mojavia pulchra JT2-VF2]|jgi:SAM-dependent methyltransferase|uniref:Class I SAM-dependent methyltransferase n=1 Tax=Mojavia pulchra JT2-VF2 TaxID=287848 RepID=A0A951Q6Y6_9NOST|nr:class I SAM-dependent methyltransferase [Mojavia pulchra JT2-VF2]
MNQWYKEDLAFIHDVGFRDFALKSAPGILEILNCSKICAGLVVDLGCGSGLWAQELTKANYDVLGVDISESMIAIAREKAPNAEFRVGSLFKTDIPPCNAITSIGECLSYLFDPDNESQTLIQLFYRIYDALKPGGVFIFDIAETGQVKQGTISKGFTEGKDWVVLVEKEENREQQTLTRKIISFRKVGQQYRRSDEIHCLRLYKATDVARELRQVGFRVQTIRSYGKYHLAKGHVGFIARRGMGAGRN